MLTGYADPIPRRPVPDPDAAALREALSDIAAQLQRLAEAVERIAGKNGVVYTNDAGRL